ncbi:hypothetical protein [Nitrosococcus wardiae]|nr:hypothetical protein [Nitrosococcus wardiae]
MARLFRDECIGVITGQTRAFYNFLGKFGVLEHKANIVANLPAQYGKNAPKPDIGTVYPQENIATKHALNSYC